MYLPCIATPRLRLVFLFFLSLDLIILVKTKCPHESFPTGSYAFCPLCLCWLLDLELFHLCNNTTKEAVYNPFIPSSKKTISNFLSLLYQHYHHPRTQTNKT
uniref:Secreted protein n=1 Tax=Cacopsylla melanoneura TaxID=428564 RepID=A0A8D8PM28_9HEMI